ncbi:MAG TPA: 50S ribosomal protein L18Ae [Methanobacterium sp.]|jgi:large subunit ribosomal protein LX|nr:50S ribosomal protein L18a [Methanobacterium sp.]HOI39367.1 50S ribosomal protein L18Ae [Methanobacterium sp.]
MKTKIFRVQGKFIMGDTFKPFTRELKAIGEDDIKEKIYSEFGSKHHIVRNQIHIEKIDEISAEDVVDPLIKNLISE